ncbi:hypothetical protein N2600_19700 [Rhizobium sp. WSM1274]|uniref:hypothetical protein n=1 Tax=Rhizobium sp. WSM1274 TaxID=3138254 RepID=UPI0021A30C49|nr:hypothetical protein [Rhizobium leguminosarum]UWU27565.1 hypothetical protein N2600_19700 [Rhizobium leguminosarum bv. viciae]
MNSSRLQIGGGTSLPPDASRSCSGQHTAALLRAVANLKRYKSLAVKPSLDSREKYGYFAIILNLLRIIFVTNKTLKFKTFSFVDCVRESSCYCVGKSSMENQG